MLSIAQAICRESAVCCGVSCGARRTTGSSCASKFSAAARSSSVVGAGRESVAPSRQGCRRAPRTRQPELPAPCPDFFSIGTLTRIPEMCSAARRVRASTPSASVLRLTSGRRRQVLGRWSAEEKSRAQATAGPVFCDPAQGSLRSALPGDWGPRRSSGGKPERHHPP